MIAIDACVLSLLIYKKSGIPNDFATKKPIESAHERVAGLVKKLEGEAGSILIPSPALSEALCVVAPNCKPYVDELESQSCFRIRQFGTRAAIEVAMRVRTAKDAGDKREGLRNWDKIKYDRQIVAIAKVEKVEAIYSTDEDIHIHGRLWGIPVYNISSLEVPATQELFDFAKKQAEYDASAGATETAPNKGSGSVQGNRGSSASFESIEEKQAPQISEIVEEPPPKKEG